MLTIGVYGFEGQSFIRCLLEADVGLLLDVRLRRGVRGTEYAWANSRRLQGALAEAHIQYVHLRQLAPTTELRHLQYAQDKRLGVGKRSRQTLAEEYVHRYTQEILDPVDLQPLMSGRCGIAALFCVERDPEACHRGLIAQRLGRQYGIEIGHLRPDGAE